ncbi:mitochondrial fission process protein 1 [Pararge aegeria]|uniref:Mitochondrial fission process protein 1 n=1 Tax=Pararge aegeria aegeria TaxID=348720 RepID=A0A8S4SP71_9NEOP|nr:mitochondrial fission process protein 1 [Pararge aegeria]CAH2268851.1 jg27178 [Pararge aegeria aegeria]
MVDSEKDLFRDTWVRFIGYSNEVGESFRPVVPVKVVRATYGVAFAYVLADTVDKSWKMFSKGGGPKKVFVETGDALVWQTLASVAIPGLVINRICHYTQKYLAKKVPKIAPAPRKIAAVAVGLASIPLIVYPIDKGVTLLMNATYRKWFHT